MAAVATLTQEAGMTNHRFSSRGGVLWYPAAGYCSYGTIFYGDYSIKVTEFLFIFLHPIKILLLSSPNGIVWVFRIITAIN